MSTQASSHGWRPARRNVIAAFPDMRSAREAIDALEGSGLDAVSISLEGPAVGPLTRKPDTSERDAGVTRYVGSRTAAGILIGGLTGLAIGMVAVAVVAGSATAFALAAVGGGVVGSLVGMLVAGVGSLDVTPDWELTFESDQPEGIVVAVGSNDPEEVGRAVQLLEDLHPIELRRVDDLGKPL